MPRTKTRKKAGRKAAGSKLIATIENVLYVSRPGVAGEKVKGRDAQLERWTTIAKLFRDALKDEPGFDAAHFDKFIEFDLEMKTLLE